LQVHQRGRLVALGEYINMVWNIAVGSAVGIFFGQLCEPERQAFDSSARLCCDRLCLLGHSAVVAATAVTTVRL